MAKQPIVKPWTAAEVELLISLKQKGATPRRVAVALKRPLKSVMKKALSLGAPFPHIVQARRAQRQKEDAARADAGLPRIIRTRYGETA